MAKNETESGNIYWQLYSSFFSIGILTFGGGLTMLPMLKHELVEKRRWVTNEELIDCYAIGQCTPGIIAVNTATFVGYKKKGVWGGITSTLGMVTPSIVIILALASCIEQFIGNVWVGHALMGIRGIVAALMVNTVIGLGKKSLVSPFSCAICIIAALCVLFTDAPTILIVVVSAVCGIIYSLVCAKKSSNMPRNNMPDNDNPGNNKDNNQRGGL